MLGVAYPDARVLNADYAVSDLTEAFRAVGMRRGDVVFSHSNVGFFGVPAGGGDRPNVLRTILSAFVETLGPQGTLAVPTFSYSFARGGPFDVDRTPSTSGLFSEHVRLLPGARRSRDPLFAVSALGDAAAALVADVPVECFGRGSFWERLHDSDGLICNLNLDAGSTFVHYVERSLGVPYRYDKMFCGTFIDGTRPSAGWAVHFVHDESEPRTGPAFQALDRLAREREVARSARVGRGAVVAYRARALFDLIAETLPQRRWLLTRAEGDPDPPPLFRDPPRIVQDVRDRSSPPEVLESLWSKPRHRVSAGLDEALRELGRVVPLRVRTFPSGSPAWDWLVPERWECLSATLRSRTGRTLVTLADDPLHVASYSAAFRGVVTQEELSRRVRVHPRLPEAVPFAAQHCWKDWALCVPRCRRDELTEPAYEVEIDARFARGALAVGEFVVPGRTRRTVLVLSHLATPHMANDGISGVAVWAAAARRLANGPRPRLTYHFLAVPDAVGTAAYLEATPDLLDRLDAALFLDMLGLEYPHSLRPSSAGDTLPDRVWTHALLEREPGAAVRELRLPADHDEEAHFAWRPREVPMLVLTRTLPADSPDHPYAEYRSNRDTVAICSPRALLASTDMALGLLSALDRAEH